MVLATIIRLEMAYPGVGILAGDSLQYLTVVTAHAVVMVFFMIMPLLFGAFANFLIPTQLGVHDVAFPRLNSAAFWFLPAGFLMLCQLVCIDRRYQRMNCFNIREVQTLLRSKYQPSFSEVLDHHQFLDNTAISLRFKLNGLDSIDSGMSLSFENSLNILNSSRDGIYFTTLSSSNQSYPYDLIYRSNGILSKFLVEGSLFHSVFTYFRLLIVSCEYSLPKVNFNGFYYSHSSVSSRIGSLVSEISNLNLSSLFNMGLNCQLSSGLLYDQFSGLFSIKTLYTSFIQFILGFKLNSFISNFMSRVVSVLDLLFFDFFNTYSFYKNLFLTISFNPLSKRFDSNVVSSSTQN